MYKIPFIVLPALVAVLVTTQGILPNSKLTPGITNPNINQQNISQNICNKHWSTSSIRPPVSYTNKIKKQSMKQYGYTDSMANYELDHLISLEIGGNPTDPKNLWPESYFTKVNGKVVGAHQKDLVENELHKEVCNKTITLIQAQQIISTDWYSFYAKHFK